MTVRPQNYEAEDVSITLYCIHLVCFLYDTFYFSTSVFYFTVPVNLTMVFMELAILKNDNERKTYIPSESKPMRHWKLL